MLRIIIAALLVMFAIFASCKRAEPPITRSTAQAQPGSEARDVSNVEILFSGLMVFHEKQPDKYEVGILQPDADHKFTVSVDGTDIPYDSMLPGPNWTLEVPGQTSPPSIHGEQAIRQRRPDNQVHQFDFGWIIDLEDFHNDLPEIEAGYLKPIIQLPNGELFTKYKSYDLMRWQGGDPNNPPPNTPKFGFVPETIAVALKLSANQELILRDDQRNQIKLIPKPHNAFHVVVIKNVPIRFSQNSDFHHYYKLFNNYPRNKQYHFKRNDDEADISEPNNPFPGHKNAEERSKLSELARTTCCMMACTAVRTTKTLR